MKTGNLFVVFALICLFFFVSAAQSGCQSSQASQTGLDFILISRQGFLNSGSLIHQDDSFYAGVKIENYDLKEHSGMVCVKDDVDDGFGGISSSGLGECQPFVVRAAEKTEAKKGMFGSSASLNPGTLEVFYPKDSEYSYRGMPEMLNPYSANIIVSLQYSEVSQSTGTVTLPGTEQPIMAQEPSQISVSAAKTIYPRSQGYLLDLDINFLKQPNARIFLPDFSKENFTQFNVNLVPLNVDCSIQGKPVSGVLDLGETGRTIKCSTFVTGKNDQSFPLVVSLNFGVILEKKFGFNIVTSKS